MNQSFDKSSLTTQQVTQLQVALAEAEDIIEAKDIKIQETQAALHQTQTTLQVIEQKLAEKTANEAYLKKQIAELKRQLYGQRRERFVPKEGALEVELPLDILEENKVTQEEKLTKQRDATRKSHRKHPGRAKLPDHLPVEEVHIYPEGDLSEMVCIGKEVKETLACVPTKYYIKRYIRYKYAPKDKMGKPVVGTLPEQVIAKGIPDISVLVSVLVSKYYYHLPLDRILKQFAQEGIRISPSTIGGWVRRTIECLEILYEHLRVQIQNEGYVQADESPIRVLDRDKKGKTHTGYYWVYHSPLQRLVLFDYQKTRGYEGAKEMLGSLRGFLQTDGYAVYQKLAKENEQITHVACWAHARREFEKAVDNDQNRAKKALAYIQKLYEIERKAREEQLNPTARKILRLDKALPVLNQLSDWMTNQLSQILPKSSIYKAIAYCSNRWQALTAYLYNGSLEIDNNLIENSIRPLALGRKNYLFSGSHDAAQRAAVIYTFFANCKKHEVNPHDWLTYALENIMDTPIKELHKLYPQNFKA